MICLPLRSYIDDFLRDALIDLQTRRIVRRSYLLVEDKSCAYKKVIIPIFLNCFLSQNCTFQNIIKLFKPNSQTFLNQQTT